MKIGTKLRSIEGSQVAFMCPGCDQMHAITVNQSDSWTWNNDADKPTFSPSILVQSGHYSKYRKHDHVCWCTYREDQIKRGETPTKFKCGVCHSFVRDGKIEFLTDSTHHLAGQTVDLPDLKE